MIQSLVQEQATGALKLLAIAAEKANVRRIQRADDRSKISIQVSAIVRRMLLAKRLPLSFNILRPSFCALFTIGLTATAAIDTGNGVSSLPGSLL